MSLQFPAVGIVRSSPISLTLIENVSPTDKQEGITILISLGVVFIGPLFICLLEKTNNSKRDYLRPMSV